MSYWTAEKDVMARSLRVPVTEQTVQKQSQPLFDSVVIVVLAHVAVVLMFDVLLQNFSLYDQDGFDHQSLFPHVSRKE